MKQASERFRLKASNPHFGLDCRGYVQRAALESIGQHRPSNLSWVGMSMDCWWLRRVYIPPIFMPWACVDTKRIHKRLLRRYQCQGQRKPTAGARRARQRRARTSWATSGYFALMGCLSESTPQGLCQTQLLFKPCPMMWLVWAVWGTISLCSSYELLSLAP